MSDTEGLEPEAMRELLAVARRALQGHLSRGVIPDYEPEHASLEEHHAVFVTLEVEGKVRGCVGQPDADGPLHESVARMAVAAAIDDPHATALELSDVRYTEVEISVLSEHRPIAPDAIEVGTHGLYIAAGPKRAILLPQTSESGWSVKRLLQELTSKAGLKRSALNDPKTSLRGFTVQVFRDSDMV